MKLNKEQEIVANWEGGHPALVLSVPGSGKTTTLSVLVANLVKKGITKVCCISFTNVASNAIAEKVAKQLGLNTGDKLPIFCGTCHRLCLSILKAAKRNGYNENLTILDSDDQKSLIKKTVRKLSSVNQSDDVECKTKFDMDSFVREINMSRECFESKEEMESRLIEKFNDNFYVEVANEYIDNLRNSNTCDFVDIQYACVKMLQENPDILSKMHNKFTHIIFDECQDISKVILVLVEMLGRKNRNVMFIGDNSQLIMSFRSGKIDSVPEFINIYKDDIVQYALSSNYRSTKTIVDHSRVLIEHNKMHMKVDYHTDNEIGEPVVFQEFENATAEAQAIANKIKLLIEEGHKPSEIAVLYRINSLAIELQIALNNLGIQYIIKGGGNFFASAHIGTCLAAMKYAINPSDSAAYNRVAEHIPSIGDKSIGALEELARQAGKTTKDISISIVNGSIPVKSKKIYNLAQSLIDIFNIDHSSASMSIKSLVDNLKLNDYLEKKYPKDFIKRQDDIKSLIENASLFDTRVGGGLRKYLDGIMLATEKEENEEDKNNSVQLVTMHKSKGDEWDTVFICHCAQNLIPHKMCLQETDNVEQAIELERNLMYVAISRPRKNLYCTTIKKTYKRDNTGKLQEIKMKPSQYLYEAKII